MRQWLYLSPKVQPVSSPLERSALLPSVPSFASIDLPNQSYCVYPGSTREIWQRIRRKLKGAVLLSLLCKELRLYGTSSFLKGQNINYKRNVEQLLTRLKERPGETESQPRTTSCVLLPNSSFRKGWNSLIVALLLYTALVMPYRLAFMNDEEIGWFVVERIVDGLFFLDVILTCFTAVEDLNGTLITDLRLVFGRYLRSWLLLDLVACVPFSLLGDESDSPSGTHNSLVRLLRLPRLYRLLRITRLYRLAIKGKNAETVERLQDYLAINRGVTKIVYFAVSVLLSLHVSGCLWYYLARLQGFGLDTWVSRAELVDSPDASKYIAAVYWACFTLTTVGYGDVTGFTDMERLYSIVWMSFSIGVYSFTIGSLTSILTSLNTRSKSIALKLNAADQMAREGRLNQVLRQHLRRAIRINSERAELDTNDKRLMFDALPKQLRYEVASAMYDGAVTRVSFFQHRSPEFISSIVPYLRYLYLDAGDLIYDVGDDSDEVYILLRGRVAFMQDNSDVIFKSMLQGTYFGDVEVILRSKRLCGCLMEWEGELLVMSKAMLRKIAGDFPEVYTEMQKLALSRREKLLASKADVQEALARLQETAATRSTTKAFHMFTRRGTAQY